MFKTNKKVENILNKIYIMTKRRKLIINAERLEDRKIKMKLKKHILLGNSIFYGEKYKIL